MNVVSRSALRTLSAVALTAVVGVSSAQTPAQLEYERQQREYWRQQEQQRQEQQRQQQIMQDNARRQQEEGNRINAPSGQSSGSPAAGAPQGTRGGAPVGAQESAARAMWEKRPALPPDRNPLLGKWWMRPPSTHSNSSDPFAGIMAMAKGGLCEVLFGGGIFEFRPDRLVGKDAQTPEQELDRVEYRGDAKHVVVLPKTTLKLMEFDVEGPDRINWASQKCVLVRAGAAASGPSTAKPVQTNAAPTPAARPGATGGGVITFSVGAPSPENKAAGRMLWLLKQDPQVALIQAGMKQAPNATVLQTWMRACASKAPDCEKGARALQPYSVGYVTTDANGRVQTPTLPLGRYWVLSDTKVGNKRVMWHEPVDLKAGTQSLTLDQHNAMPVD